MPQIVERPFMAAHNGHVSRLRQGEKIRHSPTPRLNSRLPHHLAGDPDRRPGSGACSPQPPGRAGYRNVFGSKRL